MNQGKLYRRYADDFVFSHEFHDAIDAFSRNEHQKNFHILQSLLLERRDLVESVFSKEDVCNDDLLKMLHIFNTTIPSSKAVMLGNRTGKNRVVSFHSCMNIDDCDILVRCCNDASVFKESVTSSDLLSLFEGKRTAPLHSRNNRLVAFFFTQLSIYDLIIRNWQYVLANNKSIVSSTGVSTLAQKNLSEAVYANSNMELSSQMKMIEAAVRHVGQKYQSK